MQLALIFIIISCLSHSGGEEEDTEEEEETADEYDETTGEVEAE